MTAYTDARDRLTTDYYNSGLKSVANPGGFGNFGHQVNFPLALSDVGIVFAELDASLVLIAAATPGLAAAVADSAASAAAALASEIAAAASAAVFTIATTAEIRSGSTAHSVSPAGIYAALGLVALADGATVTPDFDAGLDFTWTAGGSRTLANPINAKVGQRGSIETTVGGAGGWVHAVGSAWKREGGLALWSTTPGAIDLLEYEVKAVSAGVATRVVYTLIKAPS